MERTAAERLRAQMAFAAEIDKLKSVLRRTRIMDGSRLENTAEHSWHISVMAMLLPEWAGEQQPDVARVIRLLLVHDLVEIDAGDTFAYDEAGYRDKEAREQAAAERIFGLLPEDQREEWLGWWREFEEGRTLEARYAAGLDRLQAVLNNYYTDGESWRQHGVRRSQVLQRLQVLEETCPPLWRYVQELLQDAVNRGILLDGAKEEAN